MIRGRLPLEATSIVAVSLALSLLGACSFDSGPTPLPCALAPLAAPVLACTGGFTDVAGASQQRTATGFVASIERDHLEVKETTAVASLRWTLPVVWSLDLTVGDTVTVDCWSQQGFGGSAQGVRITDKRGIVLLSDDGRYGNAIPAAELLPFTYTQSDAGCRNRANTPGSLNNFALLFEARGKTLSLMHGSEGELVVDGVTYGALAIESTSRVDGVTWTDAPYSYVAFALARRP